MAARGYAGADEVSVAGRNGQLAHEDEAVHRCSVCDVLVQVESATLGPEAVMFKRDDVTEIAAAF